MNKRKLGDAGEDLACELLELKGHEIKVRNFRCKIGEIDIISLFNKELVFTEVKTRQSELFGLPREAVNREKQEKIKAVADYYIIGESIRDRNFNNSFKAVSFNVCEILINNIEDAF